MRNRSMVLSVLILFAIVLVSCAGPAVEAEAPTTSIEATGQPTEVVVENQPEGCLGSSETALVDLNCEEITIAVENAYLPFNYISLETGEPGGWDYDTWNEICARLHCTPVFVEAAWDGLIQAVSDGQYDVGADGISITPDRQEIVAFSDGYIQIQQKLLVRAGESRFTSIEEFAENEEWILGTQVSTTNYETAIKYLPEERVKAFEQFPFAVQALLAGDVDAVIIDEVVGMGYQGENSEELLLIGPSISSDELGFIFPLGSDLVGPVNQALAAMVADGTLSELNLLYFGPEFDITSEDIQ